MKRVLFVMLLVRSFCSFAQKNYFENSPVWVVQSQCPINSPECIEINSYNYYLNGDTIISGLSYKKVFKKGEVSFMWSGSTPTPSYCKDGYSYYDTITPSRFVRQEGKKIFIYLNGYGDSLLCNYDLTIGSPLPASFINSQINYYFVDAIDSIIVDSQYFNIFKLSPTNQFLIEGVGHDYGFIESINLNLGCATTLNCYGQGHSSFFPLTGYDCNLPIGIQLIENDLNQILVYPTVTHSSFTIELDKAVISIGFLITDLLGHYILGDNIEETRVVDISNLPSGIYFINLFSRENNSIIRKKIIKY